MMAKGTTGGSSAKIIDFGDLRELRQKNLRKKIVHCHGVFDVIHAGHLAYFQAAKRHGDLLVVSLTADKFVNKGPGRPLFTSAVRAAMMAALEVCDYVVISHYSNAVPVIDELRPNFYAKGPDYKNKQSDVTGGIVLEEEAVKRGGGKMVFTDDVTFSSSTVINQLFAPWSADQTSSIESVKKAGGLSEVERILSLLSKETVVVIGEPIVDTYTFCIPEALSSKSPTISAKYLYKEDYAGGSLAIANHLADFVKSVKLILTHGNEQYFTNLLRQKLDPRVELIDFAIPDFPTARKTRFISAHRSERIFEMTELRADQWFHNPSADFCKAILKTNKKNGVSILADFGHGLFEKEVLEAASKLQGFVGLNVQTNSSNFGYNPFTKHKRFSYLSLDTNEVRVAYRDKFNSAIDLAYQVRDDLKDQSFAMTFGSYGSYYFPKKPAPAHYSPAFADGVVDPTGAGDAFFGITSLLVRAGCPPTMIPFLGNVFAGLKTKVVGNKSAVSKASFIKAITSILK